MTDFSRRAFLGTSALGAAAVLAGCSPGSTATTTIAVTLAAAQAEAEAINSAVQTLGPALVATLSSATQAKANAAIADLGNATSAFDTLAAPLTPATAAQDFVTVAGSVVGLLSLPADTVLAINAGLVLLKGLVAGLSSVTVTVPVTAPTVSAVRGSKAAAPIAIPLA